MEPYAPVPARNSASVTSAKLKATFPDLVKEFDEKYDAWKKTWFDHNSTDPATRAAGDEFKALVALGPKIVPLVVNRLVDPDDFIAVVLYYRIEEDPSIKIDLKDISDYKVAASDIVKIDSERDVDLQKALEAWAEFRLERQNYSSSFHFTEGEGYWSLVDMGPSIIASVMLEYNNDRGGWWHELLHELVHGQVSDAGVFFKGTLFASWRDWFEHKDYEDAPKGKDAQAQLVPFYK